MDKSDENTDKFSSYYSQLSMNLPPLDRIKETTEVCPECGEEITRNGRCRTCTWCGWSSCDL